MSNSLARLQARGKGQKTCIVNGGRRKIHTSFQNGDEMVEEYDLKTDELLERKVREKNTMGAHGPWTWEIGEEVRQFNPNNDMLVMNSSNNPTFTRYDSKPAFVWRIRNLPYPKNTYSVELENDQIVVKTSNKKYYKRIEIPELKLSGEKVDAKHLSWDHQNNTLVIEYAKPKAVLAVEEAARREMKTMKVNVGGGGGVGGDQECKQQ